jgi:hypothetical protein
MKPRDNYLDCNELRSESAETLAGRACRGHDEPSCLYSCRTCFAMVHESQLDDHFMWHLNRGETSL